MEFTLSKSFTAVAKKRKKIEDRIDDCVEHMPEAWAEDLAERFKEDPSNPWPVEWVFHTVTPISHQVLPITENGRTEYLITAVVQATFALVFEDDDVDEDSDEADDVVVEP
ncbi:hypothetical protein [Tomitella biformata]|uniref:hypothetical protein n=1 Tax=Tomitella biformata TaxID=630403 RepID=UPI0004641510|nr:hypothetical protein [Tomitella biformata]